MYTDHIHRNTYACVCGFFVNGVTLFFNLLISHFQVGHCTFLTDHEVD